MGYKHPDGYEIKLIQGVIDWIEEHLDAALTVDEVAVGSGYTKWHLQRIFTARAGVPMGRYIRERLLTVTVAQLPQVSGKGGLTHFATHYGYESQQAFNRLFKHHFGLTPGQVMRGASPDPDKLRHRLQLVEE